MTVAGPVIKLQRSFAYRLSKWFPSEMLRWMDVVSGFIDSGGGELFFATIAGTSGLVSISLVQLGLLPSGAPAWVESVKDEFRWDPASLQTADGITVVQPTAIGPGLPGRFIRQNIPDPAWMSQLSWFIDPANVAANDENAGSNAAFPLKTDAERQRRMGTDPLWNGGDPTVNATYHIRYISDVPAADIVRITGRTALNGMIFLHGSATNGAGQAVLYSGTITALDTLVSTSPTNRSWQLTSAGLPVSWTASNLINQRVRLTSGTLGKSFAIKDLTGKKARCCEFLAPNTYTQPFAGCSAAQAAPVNGDTFVVERLTSIPNCLLDLRNADDGSTNTGFVDFCAESLSLGVPGTSATPIGDVVIGGDGDNFAQFDGCRCCLFGGGVGGVMQMFTMAFLGFFQPGNWTIWNVAGGYADSAASDSANFGIFGPQFGTIGNNFMFQAGGAFVPIVQSFVQFNNFAVFDGAATRTMIFAGTRAALVGNYWGQGNVGSIISLVPSTQLTFFGATAFNVATTANPEISFLFGGALRTSIPAYNETVAPPVWTTVRTTTVAHLTGTIAAGGFANNMWDPQSNSAIVKS
jgi:hypothetical protein